MTETHTCDWHDVQGLVLRGYNHLLFAECLILRFHDHRSAHLWLQQAVKRVSRGDERPSPTACAIALSQSGLLKAAGSDGGSGGALRFFSREFSEGMSGAIHRSRILGDSGRSHPMTWQWGGPRDPVGALVFACAESQAALDELRGSVVPAAAGDSVTRITLTDLHQAEHFGFRDGLSQPILEGTRMAQERPHSHHIVKLGEILLGYPDNGGFVAPIPGVLDNQEFGKNGTYLVCRQLEQDVARFHQFACRAAEMSGRDGAAGAEFVKAKMIGRWPGGAPLLPPSTTDAHHDDNNEFGFFEHDRQGLACPIGAHIRRANPRDTLESEDKDRWKASNRHRILRRGRSYGPHWSPDEKKGVRRGLLFVGLNGDIERQFEFIQHNWLNDPAFGGLVGESDPVLGDAPSGRGNDPELGRLPEQSSASGHPLELRTASTLTVPGSPARRRRTDLDRFVITRGGEYFFLPGLRALEFLAGI